LETRETRDATSFCAFENITCSFDWYKIGQRSYFPNEITIGFALAALDVLNVISLEH
jgi:hypothetical protein